MLKFYHILDNIAIDKITIFFHIFWQKTTIKKQALSKKLRSMHIFHTKNASQLLDRTLFYTAYI